jgi:hypothetical protein
MLERGKHYFCRISDEKNKIMRKNAMRALQDQYLARRTGWSPMDLWEIFN